MITTQTPWALAPGQLLAELGTSAGGLDTQAVAARLAAAGPNALPAAEPERWYVRLWHHTKDVLVALLVAAAVIKAVMRDWVDFAVIVAVVVINIAVGLIQEGRATKALDAIRGMLSLRATALRDGAWGDVDAAELVPGDVIRVRPGDRVPADARLLEATNLQVEESALTGESVAAAKDVAPVAADAELGDRTSMLFSSTLVVAGTGVAVVTGTGADTQIGRIQELVAQADETVTPLERTMATFGKWLAVGILAMAAIMVFIGTVIHHWEFSQLVSATIGFTVAAIPEGLPALVTITLALGVQAMARRRAISRQMNSVETLGSVSVICSDKTGTLTQNEMTVREAVTRGGRYLVTGTGYAPIGQVRAAAAEPARGIRYAVGLPQAAGVGANSATSVGQVCGAEPTTSVGPTAVADDAGLQALAQTMALCNDAEIAQGDDQRWQLIGEPTEGAVLVFSRKAGADVAGWARLAEIPFDSATKYMATVNRDPVGERWVVVKGGLDAVAKRCSTQLAADGRGLEPYDAGFWDREMLRLAGQGQRVLAGARCVVADDACGYDYDFGGDGPRQLAMVGITGIVDPPRPEAIAAVARAHSAGIAVSMITGDHAATAQAIAGELGITTRSGEAVLTGAELEAMDDARLRELAPNVHVYARTSPEHKIRIVRALQSRGEVVAMTGDGVNDAPALKQADVGVAMGIKGTEATKEAADIVLADDNFATITEAVWQGRRIYDNIRKAVLFMLPTNGAQGLGLLVATILGWAVLPLQPVQVLWINMVTGVTLALPLATEPAEPGIRGRPPRDPREPLLTGIMFRRILLASVLIGGAAVLVFWVEFHLMGRPLPHAQAVAITMLTLGQTAYLFNCRFLDQSSITLKVLRGNAALWAAVGAMIMAHVALLTVPFLRGIFRVASITWREWLATAGISLAIFCVIEFAKWLGTKASRRNPRGTSRQVAAASPQLAQVSP